MSKYIKLEDAIDVIEYDNFFTQRNLESLPTIDIVHCGECKYFNENKCWNLKGLNKTDGVVKADDFCSNGERKGNE